MSQATTRYNRGKYTSILGKLSVDDAREAYVTGPFPDGSIRPMASFWRWGEAVAFVDEKYVEVLD